MLSALTIARNTLIESLRQPVIFLLVIASGILQILGVWWSAYSMGYTSDPGEVTSDDKLLFDIGLSTIFVCGMLLTAFISTAVLSREIENKTLLTMVSKPIPRAAVILGKFLGVAIAMLMAVTVMLIFLLLALRHGVLSTAADTLDGPVLVFGLGAVALSVILATITNFLYGWSFPQITIVSLVPLSVIALVAVLAISPEWEPQPLSTDFLPQVTIACVAIAVSILVMTAIAIAASTRLGQVMTIVVCAGAFALGLLSNYFFGRPAFSNTPIAVVAAAQPADEIEPTFRNAGEHFIVSLVTPPDIDLAPGMQFLYGPTANGLRLAAEPADELPPLDVIGDDLFPAGTPGAVVITEVDDLLIAIRNVGNPPATVRRPPEAGDFVFLEPTEINPVAAVAWAVTPNMQFFWLVDAISQGRTIPPSHLWLVISYGLAQIVTFLGVAVFLFESRDVG